ncbi:hypothetical protein ACOSP7_022591 [Xanthoceras sorbifolium]
MIDIPCVHAFMDLLFFLKIAWFRLCCLRYKLSIAVSSNLSYFLLLAFGLSFCIRCVKSEQNLPPVYRDSSGTEVGAFLAISFKILAHCHSVLNWLLFSFRWEHTHVITT